MSEAIERVAKALYQHNASKEGHDLDGWDYYPDEYPYTIWRDYWREQASVAIEAMREPTEVMVVAAWKADPNIDEPFSRNLPEAEGRTVGSVLEHDNHGANAIVAAYTAMIDAALTESPPTAEHQPQSSRVS